MEGVKWEGRERCGEHLPAVMVHSLWLWPLSSLKMQDGERKREDVGVVVVVGGSSRVGMAQNSPSFSSATFIKSSSRSLHPLINHPRRLNAEVSEEVNKRRNQM